MKSVLFALAALTAEFLASTALADVRLPAVFSNHLVLQKAARVPMWGWADPGEKVSIALDGRQVSETTADPKGKWTVSLDLSAFGQGPFEMIVEGKNRIRISDVVIGEVWVASGQSNMEFILKDAIGAEAEISRSSNSHIRQFRVERAATANVQVDCKGQWQVADPGTAGEFTAVGYYFAKSLESNLQVPVGLIHASWGGTTAEAWTEPSAFDSDADLNAGRGRALKRIAEYPQLRAEWVKAFGTWLKNTKREDTPTADTAAFAGKAISEGEWTPIQFPGVLEANNLPNAGAVWMRRQVEIPPNLAGTRLGLSFGAFDTFDSVYWNGELIHSIRFEDFPGTGFLRRGGDYVIPANKVLTGSNTLALRFFQPVTATKSAAVPKVGPIIISGKWLAKAEYALPSLSAEEAAAVPKAPAIPPPPELSPSYLYNGMIAPMLRYGISGVIWYQGESNNWRAHQYNVAFPLLIDGWRKARQQGDFPFYYCQIANYLEKKPEPGESSWAELREAQNKTLALANTGQAVLIDMGEADDIHPRNKKEAGERLARIALAKTYGKEISFSGPVFSKMTVEDGKAHLSFSITDGGLVAKPLPKEYNISTRTGVTAPLVPNSPGSELEGFAILGDNGKWVWANAMIEGETVIVWSDKVPSPIAVRYGWADNPTCNLYNAAGLPASPFRTDDLPVSTLKEKY
ncbi:MAG: sialate O-acetylesterase [Chthoniobacterales bacterium]